MLVIDLSKRGLPRRRTGRRLALEIDERNDCDPSARSPDARFARVGSLFPLRSTFVPFPTRYRFSRILALAFPRLGGCMSEHFCAQRFTNKGVHLAGFASLLITIFSLFVLALLSGTSVAAAPVVSVRALPAFARKYGMPCSSCHEAWPKLSPFGQSFKDNGYQMGNDRDAPIFQQPAYWPATFRITPIWHRESLGRVGVDGPGGTTVEQR